MNITPLNDAARLNREVLPTDDFSAYVIPQFVFTGAVVNSEVRGVGQECPAGQQWVQPQCFQAPCPGWCAAPGAIYAGPKMPLTEGETKTMKYEWRILTASGDSATVALVDTSTGQEVQRQNVPNVGEWSLAVKNSDNLDTALGSSPVQAGILGMSPAFITLGAIGLAWFMFGRKKRR